MVNPLLTRSCVAALVLWLPGCVKKPEAEAPAKRAAVELVPEAERSRHFEAVNSHLELGGTLYAYADVDGDALLLATSAQPQLAPLGRQDFKALFTGLGLNDVKALGMSSVRNTEGIFRNRTFIFTPDGRHGLLAVFGGQPGRFIGARLAPPDTDFYWECEFDASALYDTVKAAVARVSGPDAAASFEKKLKDAGAKSGYSALDVIEGLNGRFTIIIRMKPGSTLGEAADPKQVKIPGFDAVLRVDGIGAALEEALGKDAQLTASVSGSHHLFTMRAPVPVMGIRPVLEVDGKTLYAATSADFLHECLDRQTGLDTNPQFAAGLASLGPEGNGLTWVSPRFFSRLKDIGSMNSDASPQLKRAFDVFNSNLPAITQPLFSVRSNLPDGILIRSNWNRSLKPDVAMFTVYNPVTIGLMAAMAIPTFQKVRQASQEKAAMSRPPVVVPQPPNNAYSDRIMENLRVLSEAADKYYADHNATTATFELLVGPDKYVSAVLSVAGEDYRTVLFKKGRPLRLYLKDGRVFIYPPQQ
jgi:hypothetical protein